MTTQLMPNVNVQLSKKYNSIPLTGKEVFVIGVCGKFITHPFTDIKHIKHLLQKLL